MEIRLMELQALINEWNHSAGTLDGDAEFVEGAGEIWFGDAWFEREEWTLDLSDREVLSALFGALNAKGSAETKNQSIQTILNKVKVLS